MSVVEERRRVALHVKIDSLARELRSWREASKAGAPLEKHNSQIARVTEQLFVFQREAAAELAGISDAELPTRAAALERRVLEVNRVWDFFRVKLGQRYLDHFKTYLEKADELCWACYRPAREAALRADPAMLARIKEPPLVFLNGGTSPFVLPRNAAYEAEPVARQYLETDALIEVLQSLPIPVIGLPWFALSHLPDALALGHEVGHVVELDFGLHETVLGLVDQAMDACATKDPARRASWRQWSHEVFADLYGCLAAGPAFVSTLIDALAEALAEPAAMSEYPPDAVRIGLCFHALDALGFSVERETLEKDRGAAPADPSTDPWLAEARFVVQSLLRGPYPQLRVSPLAGGAPVDARLTDILCFTRENQDRARSCSGDLLAGLIPYGSSDARELFAAACLAFDKDPDRYASAQGGTPPNQRIFDKIKRDVGIRSLPTGQGALEAKQMLSIDAAAGSLFADRFRKGPGVA